MSTHTVPVIRIEDIKSHPSADFLGIVDIDAYQVVVRTADWKVGDVAAYIEPDMVVPTDDPQFDFLGPDAKHRRIRPKRLRGVMSMGMLVPAPDGLQPGDDAMEKLRITRYEPPLDSGGGFQSDGVDGNAEAPPGSLGMLSKYDLENCRRYGKVLEPGEPVFITEKIHGANARYAFRDGRMWVGSRNQWKAESENAYWRALRANPWIEDFCRANEDAVLFGEVFGWVADLRYGHVPGEVSFRAFDVYTSKGFVDSRDLFVALSRYTTDRAPVTAPLLYTGPFDLKVAEELAEGDSSIPRANHCREGVVIKPAVERWDPLIGRVALKLVSNRYLARAN